MLPEYFCAVKVADEFEASIHQCASINFNLGYFRYVSLLVFEQFLCKLDIHQCILDVFVSKLLHYMRNALGFVILRRSLSNSGVCVSESMRAVVNNICCSCTVLSNLGVH